jgi:hypothetical protein
LRSNTKGYGGKAHYTDSQNSDTTAPSGRELYHLQSRSRRPARKRLDTPSYNDKIQEQNKIFSKPSVPEDVSATFNFVPTVMPPKFGLGLPWISSGQFIV